MTKMVRVVLGRQVIVVSMRKVILKESFNFLLSAYSSERRDPLLAGIVHGVRQL